MLPVNAGFVKDLISIPRGDPRLFDTRVFERQISLSGRTRPFVKEWLVHQGQKTLSMFLRICFLNFRYFFITCKHINISDKVNYVQNNHWREHYVNTTILPFAFKTSLAIFKFMKVELKYWRFMNSNDPILTTDIASLKKYSKPMAFIQKNI